MHSAIYRGYLRHRRFTPNAHQFSYQVFMMYLDLDELDEVLGMSPFWSRKAWRPARFKRADFLGDPALPLKQAVRERIHDETGNWHDGPVRMLANLRYFGFNINPICCYYCFDDHEALQYIVVEVTNTPWNERHSYVLRCDPEKRLQRINFSKLMHVSPFNPMDMGYRWVSNNPSRILSLSLETECEDEIHMDATMALKRREISAASLAGILLQHPWMTARVAAAIYWQALKLWIKRNPFYDHPGNRGRAELDPPTITRLKTKT
ncbi:MAG: DUF1365 domain-containing protein [Gammaproteobacteria bacterium]|nr:DUF1365 domain-containing protein [Gammaproteobacteria bacterium]MDH3534353.1 DUF1365 domain-containing protein [Gammaproteobacteria bacterium]